MLTKSAKEVLDNLLEKVETDKVINSVTEQLLKAVFGTPLIDNCLKMLVTSDFLHVKCFTSDIVEIYSILDNHTGEEYYFKPGSVFCNCTTIYQLAFTKCVPNICHHYIAMEIAKKLNKCRECKLSLEVIRQCLMKRADPKSVSIKNKV